ncbi:TonB-dependent receptor [Fulvivirga sp. 29W222]|uniref:TonB-dependent receptor n=2 Tax=Fulvivirga marina TaxID=2494733 RepID=A0A937KGT5_9BACT|nr:TonB-dependent receptor [Fulvivirga marina]MBL6449780.1 TonB-dependent receptor [Fulvivirga marina]
MGLGCLSLKAQNLKDVFVDPSDNGKIFSEFLYDLEKKYGVDFIFDEQKIQALTVNGIQERIRIIDYLDYYLVQYKVVKTHDNILFIVDKHLGEEFGKRKDNYVAVKANTKGGIVTLEGVVTDAGTDDPIVGAQVYISKLNKGALTDVNGRFKFSVDPDTYKIDIRFVGYETTTLIVAFSPYGDQQQIESSIFPESKELDGVTITAERIDRNVTSELTGVEALGIETIKSLPTFLGEVDPIKSLTTLPGVSTVGELSSGFNVRGGETGQNLILQDGATIYNPAHMFGFFSAFNPDMVSDVVLYKGGGPANFGSRVSSVLDVKLRNGDAGKHKVSGGVGLVSSRLTVEGPIKRSKSSYLLGGRISYSNWLLKATDDIQLQNSSAEFYDVTAKVFQTINENNFITVSGYRSSDGFQLASDSTFSWETTNASIRWDHTFNQNLSSSVNVASSNYLSKVDNPDPIEGFTYENAINNIRLKAEFNYSKDDKLKLLAGIEGEGLIIEPGRLEPLIEGSNVIGSDMNDQRALETAAYLQSNVQLSAKLSLSAGLRYSRFMRLGSDEIYKFDYADINGRYPAIVDTLVYEDGDVIKSFGGLEPRVSLRFLLSESSSLKASYYRGYQYLHLISNTTSTTPQDYWVASGPYLKPAMGDQFSLGAFKNFKDNVYELSVEGFYKQVSNSIDYIEGADITLNPSLEAGLTSGKGLAYGVEFLLKKNQGTVNGWIAYTFSRSLRKFDSDVHETKVINKGDYYPATYDQPHNLSLVFNYRLGGRATFSTNFSYSTGRPITIPVSKFSYEAYLSVLNYSERNEYRIPDYHRLDFSLTIKDKPRKNKRFMGEWIISVFNVYSRNNAYSIFFDRYGKASKLSVLGSAFPSISYNFTF